ncbi:MAG: hypothetical protein ACWGO1_14200, partial [Anaerolineales bacterium]
RGMLELAHPVRKTTQVADSNEDGEGPLWIPPIVRTVATENKGTAALVDAVASHRQHLLNSGEWQQRERERLSTELRMVLQETLLRDWLERIPPSTYQAALDSLYQRQISP